MPTYESSGSLTTVEQSFGSPQTPDLTGLVYTLNGETIQVDVVGSPGDAGEETQSVTLDGASSYDLTWSSAHTDFEVVFNLSTADDSQTPVVDDLTLTGGPDAPTNLTVTEVTDTPDVSLSWSDNATTENEYRVYRATSPGDTLADYTQIDTLAADTTTYTDTTVSVGTRYYYRVSAANSRGETPSGEVRAEPSDDYTNSVGWDSEREWEYGTFTDTTTDGSGNITLSDPGTVDFDYSLSTNGDPGVDAGVKIVDTNTSTTLAQDSTSADTTITGTFTIDIDDHPELTVSASGSRSSTADPVSASISDPDGTTASIDLNGDGSDSASDSFTEFYGVQSGTYTTETWDFTNTTTASRLTATSSNISEGSITLTVTIPGGTTEQVSLGGGSEEFVLSGGASDQYYIGVEIDAGADASTHPTLDSLFLESHTPVSNVAITSTDDTSNTVEWTGWGSADEYEVYRSESTPVTASDTLVTTTTNTTYTDSGLENGEAYSYDVRAEYTGE